MLGDFNALLTNLQIVDGTEVNGKVVWINATYYSLSVVLVSILLANLLIGLTVRDIDKIAELADAEIVGVELKQIYEATARNAITCKPLRCCINQKPVNRFLTLNPNKPERRRWRCVLSAMINILPEYVLQKEVIYKETQALAKNRFDKLAK